MLVKDLQRDIHVEPFVVFQCDKSTSVQHFYGKYSVST